nr:MAG TPA: hypothetical protein [Bacteriophage sp.]
MVSDIYKNLTYLEENNLKHEIKVFNTTRNVELTDYLEMTDLATNKFLENESNAISPNTLNLTFSLRKREREKIPDYFDQVEDDFFDNDNYFDNLEDIRDYLVIEGDEIRVTDTFNSETIDLFVGVAKELNLREELLYKYLRLVVKDRTSDGYSKRFDKDYTYIDYYIFNKNEKERSLLYILAKKIGFSDDKIDIEDIQYSLGDYIKISTAKFEKDKSIMQELAEIVRSVVGNVYVKNDGTLKITSLLNQRDTREIDYTLKLGNILEYLEAYESVATQNKVEVKFTENKVEKRQVVFALAGQNASAELDDARVIVKANTVKNDTYWLIEYITTNVRNLDKRPEVKAYKMNHLGAREYINYTDYVIELNENKGKVKFLNPHGFDIFIEKFKLYGEPVFEYEGSNVTYTEKVLKEHEIELKSIENKYVQELRHAQVTAKYSYFLNCRNVKKFKLVCNSVPFLELEDVIKLKYGEYETKVQITNITQKADSTELELREFQIFEPAANRFENNRVNLLDKEILKNGTVDFGRIKYPDKKPPAPIGVTAEHQFLGFGIRWQALEAKDIKGYLMYIKSIDKDTGLPDGVLDTKVSVGNATYKVVKAEVGTYEVFITSLNMNGIESDKSETVVARSLKVDGTQMNVDGDSLVVDTTKKSKPLVLGTVYAKNLGANSVTANAIAAESVTANKLLFANLDGLYKDPSGGIMVKGDKLTITTLTLFENDVQLNGKVIGENGILVESNNRRTSVKGGKISFEEKNNVGEWKETRVMRKMAAGVYRFFKNGSGSWVNLREITNGVEWESVTIVAALESFDINPNARQMFCDVIKHPNDKHLFQIKVGGATNYQETNILFSRGRYTWEYAVSDQVLNSITGERTLGERKVIFSQSLSDVSGFTAEYTATRKIFYKEHAMSFKRRRRAWYMVFNAKMIYRFTPRGQNNWSGWIEGAAANLDSGNTGQRFDVEIQFVCENVTLTENNTGYEPRADTFGELNINLYFSRTVQGEIFGGTATWIAFEGSVLHHNRMERWSGPHYKGVIK